MMKLVRKKIQVGFAPIILIAVIAAAAIIGGFFLLRQGKISLPLPGVSQIVPRVTEKDFEFIEDANLRKHFVAQANQTTYRSKNYENAAGLVFVTEVQIKKEFFNTREIEYEPVGNEPMGKETKHKIEIGNTIYVKDYSDGKWWKQTITPEEEKKIPEEEKPAEPLDFKAEYSKPDLKFKFLGKEACGPSAGGLTCFKYEQLTGGPEEMAFKRIFWFDDKKYLLRKEESTVGEFKVAIEYSYDNINITAPSPTKDVPEGKSIYDYYYGTETKKEFPLPKEIPTIPEESGF